MAVVNCGVQRWTIHAPANDQYEKDDEGEWVEWDAVKGLLWERDEARTEADELRKRTERAVTWLVTVKGDQPASIIADRARLALEALRGAREPCPACGPGPCTPACPEREWRYAR